MQDNSIRRERLLERASEFLDILRSQARRAFVLELTGTPKAGKSTSVVTLQTFFKQAGYQVHLLRERAADCPLPMKGHFFSMHGRWRGCWLRSSRRTKPRSTC